MNAKPVNSGGPITNEFEINGIISNKQIDGFVLLFRELVYESRSPGSSQAECGSIKELADHLSTPFSNFLLQELQKEQSYIGWLDREQQTFMVHSVVGLGYAYEIFSQRKYKNVNKRIKNALNENVKTNILNRLDENLYQFKFKK